MASASDCNLVHLNFVHLGDAKMDCKGGLSVSYLMVSWTPNTPRILKSAGKDVSKVSSR